MAAGMPLLIWPVFGAGNVIDFREFSAAGEPALFEAVEQTSLVVLDKLGVAVSVPFLHRAGRMIVFELSFVNFVASLPASHSAIADSCAIGDFAALLAS